jgi:hypothetical protein
MVFIDSSQRRMNAKNHFSAYPLPTTTSQLAVVHPTDYITRMMRHCIVHARPEGIPPGRTPVWGSSAGQVPEARGSYPIQPRNLEDRVRGGSADEAKRQVRFQIWRGVPGSDLCSLDGNVEKRVDFLNMKKARSDPGAWYYRHTAFVTS